MWGLGAILSSEWEASVNDIALRAREQATVNSQQKIVIGFQDEKMS